MRISDWSSDVCSSDLLPRQYAAQHDRDAQRQHQAHDEGDGQRLLIDAGELQAVGNHHAGQQLPAVPQLHGNDAHRLRRVAARAVERHDLPAPVGGQPGRSEEHTSELQSLMRISYAVFCLKKKNYHTTTNTTTIHKIAAYNN